MIIDPEIIAVTGTLLGAVIGLGAGPVKDCFTDRTERKKLRKALYSELITAFEQIDNALVDYCSRCNPKYMDFLRSTDKISPITFPVYDTLNIQPIPLYQLEEASKLIVAYFRLQAANDVVKYVNRTPFNNVEEAKKECNELRNRLYIAACYIDDVFENNEDALKKLDNGACLNEWRKIKSPNLRPQLATYLLEKCPNKPKKNDIKAQNKVVNDND